MKIIGLLVFLLAGFGCASVEVHQLRAFEPREEFCALDVYGDVSEVKKKFQVACIIDSKTSSALLADKSPEKAIENAKPKACSCGADAIIIQSAGQTGDIWVDPIRGVASIKAIKYLDK